MIFKGKIIKKGVTNGVSNWGKKEKSRNSSIVKTPGRSGVLGQPGRGGVSGTPEARIAENGGAGNGMIKNILKGGVLGNWLFGGWGR